MMLSNRNQAFMWLKTTKLNEVKVALQEKLFLSSLDNLWQAFGHSKSTGLCNGFSIKWLEASLLGEEENLKERVEK